MDWVAVPSAMGLTECRPALAAAAAEAVASGRPLWIPPGVYRVTCDETNTS